MGGDDRSPALSWVKGAAVSEEDAGLVLDRESSVIGAVLVAPTMLPEISFLEPRDFLVAELRSAWSVIMSFAGSPNVGAKLTPMSISRAAGIDHRILFNLTMNVATTINAIEHARIMRADRAGRAAIEAARKALRTSNPLEIATAFQAAAAIIQDQQEAENYGAAQITDRFLARFSDRMSGKLQPAPTTGIKELDERIGGLVPENLVVVAGRPGMGKTVASMSIARQATAAGSAIGYFSLEIGEDQFAARLHADAAFSHTAPPVFFSSLLRGTLPIELVPRVEAAAVQISGLPIFASFTQNPTVSQIEATADRWQEKAKRKLDAIIVDYSAFVRDTGQYRGNEVKQVGEIFRGFKIMARRLGTCVIAVHQLNRGVENREDKRPTMADLRGSGEIEQDADSIVLLYRHEYYLNRVKPETLTGDAFIKHAAELDEWKNRVEAISDKNRAGAPGSDRLFIDVGCNALRSLKD